METRDAGLTIGRLAQAGGVSVETVRFYERRGLITRPPCPAVGIRRYPEDTLRRLQFIKQAQSLGFTLQEIHEMLALRADDPAACGEMQHLATEKLALLRAKMNRLRAMESVLESLVADCRHARKGSACPILAAVEDAPSPQTPRTRP